MDNMETIKTVLNNIRPEIDFDQSTDFIEDGILDSFEIESVPCIIINQKYKITGRMAKTYQGLLDITDFLVKKKRELKAGN